MLAFHVNWTRPFTLRNPNCDFSVEPFELFTTVLSALEWQKHNGRICMICDRTAAAYYRSLGLASLWDGGICELLDAVPETINPGAFWAAGKLFALSAVKSPCVMLDTDFIVWQPLAAVLTDCDAAAIHREEISPAIYPPASSFPASKGFDLLAFDWSVEPLNTALAYFGDDTFRRYYTDTAISFMKSAPDASDPLIYMVFAEQRLLAMCAQKQSIRIRSLSNLDLLFSNQQTVYTHTWGMKQQMRDDAALCQSFCKRCAARLQSDFPQWYAVCSHIPALAEYCN